MQVAESAGEKMKQSRHLSPSVRCHECKWGADLEWGARGGFVQKLSDEGMQNRKGEGTI